MLYEKYAKLGILRNRLMVGIKMNLFSFLSSSLKEIAVILYIKLGDRLMVGHIPLEDVI